MFGSGQKKKDNQKRNLTATLIPFTVLSMTSPPRLITPTYAHLFPTLPYALVLISVQSLGVNPVVHATPLRFQHLELSKRAESSTPSVPPSIWTPALIIIVVFVGLAGLGCLARGLLRRARARRNATTDPTRTETGATVLTADQLAGGAPAAGNNANPTRRPRRPRRPRRTPSQISVTSLPEYMKEPGDQEVVIFRGQTPEPQEPRASVVVDGTEDDEDDPEIRRSPQTPEHDDDRYAPMPASPNTMPLLQQQEQEDSDPVRATDRDREGGSDDNGADISMQEIPRQASASRQSLRSGITDEINSLRRFDSNNTQASISISLPRAPPAYFEVIGDNEPLGAYYPPHSSSTILSSLTSSTNAPLLGSSSLTSPEPSASSTSPQTSAHRNRQSGLRTFLNRMSMSMPIGGGGASAGSGHHQRSHSSNSANNTGPGQSSSSFFRRPRSSHSASQSITSLTSPSMISLNSISAPLTHTASRTKFTFPNHKTTGLPTMTPEQVKIIASRDAIGRFGVPYGPDAEAFAASVSKVELGTGLPPPPGFEAVVAEGSGSRSPESTPAGTEGVETDEGANLGREPSALSTATVRPSGPEGEAEELSGSNASSSQARSSRQTENERGSILERPKSLALTANSPISTSASIPSPSASSLPRTNGIITPSTVSEFGQILQSPGSSSTSKLSPVILRSESLSSIYTSRTYATAAESLSIDDRPPASPSSSLSSGTSSPGEGARRRGQEEISVGDLTASTRIGSGRRL